jgi:outer membrane lipoprotein carrier protein
VLLAVHLVAGTAAAAEPEAVQVLARLQDWLDGTRDLTCRFEQELVSGALGGAGVEFGEMRVKRPGRMRWDYEAPPGKVAVLDAGTTSVYLPEDRQLIRGRLDDEGGAVAALLAETGRLAELFDPALAAPAPREGGRVRLVLLPRGGAAAIGTITLLLDPPQHSIAAAEVTDGAGNVLVFRFRGLRRNRGVAESAFQITVPPATEIIDAR